MHKKLSFLLLGIAFALPSIAQVSIMSGTSMSLQPGDTILLSQDLDIQSGGTISNAGSIMLSAGSFSNEGAALFTPGSALVFSGSLPQSMHTASPLTVGTLFVDNSNGLAPDNSLTVATALVLDNGMFHADTAKPLHFLSTAADPVETGTNRIVGKAMLDDMQLGTNALSFLGCNIAAGTDMGTLNLVRLSGPSAIEALGSGSSIAQSWFITSSAEAQHPARDVSFSWPSELDNGLDMTNLYLYAGAYPFSQFTQLSSTAVNVSAGNPRVYAMSGLTGFNRMFTLSDYNSLGVPLLTQDNVEVHAFPNPFNDVLNVNVVKNDNTPVHLLLSDITGKIIHAQTVQAGTNTIIPVPGAAALPPGFYIIKVYNDNFTKTLKLTRSN